MNKAELLQALKSKFHKVFTPAEQQAYDEFKYYLVKVYDLIASGLREINIAFYVENEGQPGEAAYWSPSEPKPTAQTGFQQELNAYIAQKISDGTVEAAFIEGIDPINGTAVVKVVRDVSGTLTEARLLIDKDSGNLRYRQIG